MEITEMFLTFAISSGIAFILALARMAYKSKCKEVECCGCIKIQRDTQAEIEIDEQQQTNNQDPESPRSQKV